MGGKGLRFAKNTLKHCAGPEYPENHFMFYRWFSLPLVESLGYFPCNSKNCYENKSCP